MGHFKEEATYLENIVKKSTRIYSDSCDAGVKATPAVKAEMKQVINELLELPGSHISYRVNAPRYTERTYNLFIIWERDGNAASGTEYIVGYVNDEIKGKEFFSVDIHNKTIEI